MKNRWGLLLAALLLLALAASGAPSMDGEEQGEDCLLYFLASESKARGNDQIKSHMERLDVAEDAPLKELARAVVRRLLDGSEEAGLRSPLPDWRFWTGGPMWISAAASTGSAGWTWPWQTTA